MTHPNPPSTDKDKVNWRADFIPPEDDPWQRAHTIPDFDRGPGLIAWLAAMLVIVALVAAGGLIGWFAHANAMEQVETCMEGCER